MAFDRSRPPHTAKLRSLRACDLPPPEVVLSTATGSLSNTTIRILQAPAASAAVHSGSPNTNSTRPARALASSVTHRKRKRGSDTNQPTAAWCEKYLLSRRVVPATRMARQQGRRGRLASSLAAKHDRRRQMGANNASNAATTPTMGEVQTIEAYLEKMRSLIAIVTQRTRRNLTCVFSSVVLVVPSWLIDKNYAAKLRPLT